LVPSRIVALTSPILIGCPSAEEADVFAGGGGAALDQDGGLGELLLGLLCAGDRLGGLRVARTGRDSPQPVEHLLDVGGSRLDLVDRGVPCSAAWARIALTSSMLAM